MQKVLHVLPDLGPNGYAQQVALLAPRFHQDEFRVQVATFRDSDFFRDALYAANIPVFVLGPQKPFGPTLWIALRRLINQQRPDLIHAWGWRSLRLAAAATLGMNVPVIAGDTLMSQRTSWLDRWCLRQATRHVAPNRFSGVDGTVIPFGVEIASAGADRATTRRALSLTDSAPVFLYAGAIEPGHGWRHALEVFDILEHVYAETLLLVAGDGPDRAAMAEYAAKLGVRNLRWLGWRRDLSAILEAVDGVFVFGRQGGRNVALQSLAAGTPVIAWRRTDLVEMLGEAAVFAEFDERQAIATAIRQVVESPSVRGELVERGKDRVRRFAVENVLPHWAELYRQVLLSRRG